MEPEPAMAPVVASTSARVITWSPFEDGHIRIRLTELEHDRYLVEIEKGYSGLDIWDRII